MSDNSRIAKNTLFMYIRMAFTMLVGLYTSRVILNALGVDDYGLYNVIGGIIALFSVINSALVNTTSRFITVSLGKGSKIGTRQIFNMAFLLHLIVGVMVVVLGETIGLWYLHNKLVIPEGREVAAEWLYQFTIISTFLTTIIVPYNATIIAHEKINVYAIIQIIDVFLKLIIVLIIRFAPFDQLIFYALLVFLITVFDVAVNFIYCQKKFEEIKFLFYWSWSIFKEMLQFIGWALVGNFSYMFYTQGLNLMLNAFCGTAVNAARGIAVQVEHVVKQLANNVQVSINPQILKTYANNEMQRMHFLICASTRYCYYLLFLISLPVMLEAEFLLQLWLGIVPEHTVMFIRLILVVVLLDAFINPMFTANLATGKLKQYYIPIFSLSFAFMFITYFSIKMTRIPESVFVCYLILNIIGVLVRIFVMNKQIQLKPIAYFREAIGPVLLVTLLSAVLPFISHIVIEGDWSRFCVTSVLSVGCVCAVAYFIGISKTERQFINQFVSNKIKTFGLWNKK